MTTLEKIIKSYEDRPNSLGLVFARSQILNELKKYLEDENKQLDEMYQRGFKDATRPGGEFKSISIGKY